MKYTLETYGTPSTFEKFCEDNQLEVVVHERQRDHYGPHHLAQHQYWADFRQLVEEAKGSLLCAQSGDGDTPELAIQDLAQKIRGKNLVVDAYGGRRREIKTPNNWIEHEPKTEPLWHFQELEWPAMNDPQASLCDVHGGDCTRQVENVNCEECLRLLNDHLQERFK